MYSALVALALDDDTRALGRAALALVAAALLALLLVIASLEALLGVASTSTPPPAPQRQLISGAPPGASSAPASAAVEVARGYLGVPYVFGGTDPVVGLDCSGLVQLVFWRLGVQLPRTAQQQWQATTRLGQADLQPGDLVFFARTYAEA